MSKKPKVSRHRIPTVGMPRADPISSRYQVEVDMSTTRLERRYRKAQKALEAAERRADKARAIHERRRDDHKAQRQYVDLQALVEERRSELREIERLMMPADYSGRDSRSRGARHEVGVGGIYLGGYKSKEQHHDGP